MFRLPFYRTASRSIKTNLEPVSMNRETHRMPAFPSFTTLAQSLPTTVPFVGPEAIERNRQLKVRARIGANESGFGPAPSVKQAMIAAIDETWKYTDPENFASAAIRSMSASASTACWERSSG
jgi:hypothetical protein